MRIAECGILGLMKTDSSSRRFGRSDELLDRFEDDSELLIVFVLKRFDLAGEVAVCVHEAAELHESAHDCDVDSRSPDRSSVSQTDNAVHPTASPHVVFT
jgi:hypothetical protein